LTEAKAQSYGILDGKGEEQLLLENAGLIWSVVRRYYGRGTEPDDLYQLGCLGFIKALRDFDPNYGTRFSTYAVPKIAGEIRRFLRDDGAVKVSRSLKEKAYKITQARRELEQTLGREPALSELSAETGYSPEDIAECDLASAPIDSLQRESGEDAPTLENMLADFTMEDKMVERIALKEAVESLPERERSVIVLRYWRGLTQDASAKLLGVSQVQVSRLERKGVERLRRELADQRDAGKLPA
jgi:RNA polymerase sporulation-specific sigma factor